MRAEWERTSRAKTWPGSVAGGAGQGRGLRGNPAWLHREPGGPGRLGELQTSEGFWGYSRLADGLGVKLTVLESSLNQGCIASLGQASFGFISNKSGGVIRG